MPKHIPKPTDFKISKLAGLVRLATIDHIDTNLMIAYVKFNDPQLGPRKLFPAQLPMGFLSSGGTGTNSLSRTGFIGGYVGEGTPVIVSQAEGSGAFFIVNFLARDPAAQNTISQSKIQIPSLAPGEVVIQANIDGNITLDDDGIYLGNAQNLITLDTTRNLYLNTFDSTYTLTQGSREITGVIKRDVRPAIRLADFLRSADPTYDDTLKTIGMDPVATVNSSNSGNYIRNPARIESREVIFEYEDIDQILSNDLEIKNYNPDNTPNNTVYTNINRRLGRDDILSLSLVAPNYLIESVKGSVVDVFGNILDINRSVIPIGDPTTPDPTKKNVFSVAKIKSTLDETNTFNNAYHQIKRAERKGIVIHFEMNARKEQKVRPNYSAPAGLGSGVAAPPNVNDKSDYARARSRFIFDVDKEGQIKLNVPASSEYGNVSLLTRYENYSTVNPNSKSNDPNDLVFNQNSTDILIESFVNSGVIKLVDDLGNNAAPKDRFTSDYIMHGTAYHDISKTIASFQTSAPPAYYEYVPTTSLSGTASGLVPPPVIANIVAPKITVAGPSANAGGRSGSFNFDGSIELNVGANTVDRQSVWADLQGGVIANVGRDLNNISAAISLDGQLLMEIGGRPVPTDSRFAGKPTGAVAGVLDIRVFNSAGDSAIIRFDDNGLQITTPSRITMFSNGDMTLRSMGTLTLDSEVCVIQGRQINKNGNNI